MCWVEAIRHDPDHALTVDEAHTGALPDAAATVDV